MFYPGTILANNCSNTNIGIVNDSSNHVGGMSGMPLIFPFMLSFKSARVWGLLL